MHVGGLELFVNATPALAQARSQIDPPMHMGSVSRLCSPALCHFYLGRQLCNRDATHVLTERAWRGKWVVASIRNGVLLATDGDRSAASSEWLVRLFFLRPPTVPEEH